MRIVIDLQGAQTESRFRGIGRYSQSLALAIARNAGEHEIWLVLNAAFPESILDIRHAFKGLVSQERIRVFDVPLPVAEYNPENTWRARVGELIREHFIQQLKPDFILVTSLFEGIEDDAVTSVGTFTSGHNTAVILYDLIPYLNAKTYLPTQVQHEHYARKIESVKNAGLLLSISESTRNEGIKHLGLSNNTVVNISTAVDDSFRPVDLSHDQTQKLRQNYGIVRKMVMYAPGGYDSRKNFDSLIKAYSLLSQQLRAEHQLVIVSKVQQGDRDNLLQLAKEAGLNKNELVLTGYVPDEDLIALYNLATLFVFPSKHEGFGLPVLEAMTCGAPVIASNTTSIPEVIGWKEALFDPHSPNAIAKKMGLALQDETFRKKLREHSLQQARKFSWDVSAQKAIVELEKIEANNLSVLTSIKEPKTNAELIKSIVEINSVTKPTDADIVRIAECLAFNTERTPHKQLLLDISELVQRDAKSGIQRVVRSLLQELIENPPHETDVRAIYFDGTRYRYASAFTEAYSGTPSKHIADEIVDFCQDDIYLALDLNAGLTAAIHDFHKRLQCRGINLYFIVYDILLVQHPEWWPEGTSVIFEAWLRSISEVATGLVCISEAVAEEVRAWIRLNPPERHSGPMVSSFHLGADVENSMPSKGLPSNAQTTLDAVISIPSFLMVGTIEPRKGHIQALAAFELLWTQGINVNLVIVGKGGWLVDKLIDKIRQHPELNQRLFWLEGISDEYLEKVYVAITCLIAPSEGEGFGLPLIEAAQHK